MLSAKVAEQLVVCNVRLRDLFDDEFDQYNYELLSTAASTEALLTLQKYNSN